MQKCQARGCHLTAGYRVAVPKLSSSKTPTKLLCRAHTQKQVAHAVEQMVVSNLYKQMKTKLKKRTGN